MIRSADSAIGDVRYSAPAALTSGVGISALVMGALCSAWVAIGSAGGRYLLELPTRADPAWIHGPLRGWAGLGPLGPSGVSAGLSLLVATYLIALGCARSIPLRAALAAIVVANIAFVLAPSLVSSDAYGYVAYAREAARHGLNPYVSPPLALAHDSILRFVYWKHQPSPYGPVFTIASGPLGLLPAPVAFWCLKAAAGLATVATAFLVAGIAGRRRLSPSRAAILVGMNPVLLFYAVSGAHNDLLAGLLVVAAIALAMRSREAGSAGAVVAAAAVKVTLGLALPFLLIGVRRRRRAAGGAAVAIVVIGIPTLVLFGPHVLDQVHRITTDHQFDTAYSGPDLLASALGTPIGSLVRVLATTGAGLVTLGMIVRTWRGYDPVAAAGWAFLALLASIASLAPWYLVWLLPLAALGRSRALRVAAVLATGYLVAVHLPALGGAPWLSAAGGGVTTSGSVP